MKKQLLSAVAICLTTLCFAQTDTIFSGNRIINCRVNEITSDKVKFTVSETNLTGTIPKDAVQKIVYENGNIRTFPEPVLPKPVKHVSAKKVKPISDTGNVKITQNESELQGLYRIGDITTTATAKTAMVSEQKIREKAYRKLKVKAAMEGADIVYQTHQESTPLQTTTYHTNAVWKIMTHQSGETLHAGETTYASATLSGVAYTTHLPSFDDFKALIAEKRNFTAVQTIILGSWSNDSTVKETPRIFTLKSIRNENGFIMLYGILEDEWKCTKFRVVAFTKDSFNIFYEYRNKAYNVKIEL